MSKTKRPYIPKVIRQEVYNKYNGHCAYCGKEIKYEDMQIDHIIPFKKVVHKQEDLEVIENIKNYFPTCKLCNWAKGGKSVESFRKEIKRKFKVVEKTAAYRLLVKYNLITENKDKEIKFYFEKN